MAIKLKIEVSCECGNKIDTLGTISVVKNTGYYDEESFDSDIEPELPENWTQDWSSYNQKYTHTCGDCNSLKNQRRENRK